MFKNIKFFKNVLIYFFKITLIYFWLKTSYLFFKLGKKFSINLDANNIATNADNSVSLSSLVPSTVTSSSTSNSISSQSNNTSDQVFKSLTEDSAALVSDLINEKFIGEKIEVKKNEYRVKKSQARRSNGNYISLFLQKKEINVKKAYRTDRKHSDDVSVGGSEAQENVPMLKFTVVWWVFVSWIINIDF